MGVEGRPAWVPMTDEQRRGFECDGYVIVRGALSGVEVVRYAAALDRVHAAAEGAGALAADGSLHRLSAVASCPELVALIDHPRVFPLVWSMLGWNVHVHHSHIDVHPPLAAEPPPWWHWHQDGGRQNRELETDPRAPPVGEAGTLALGPVRGRPGQPHADPRQPPVELAARPTSAGGPLAGAGGRRRGHRPTR